MTRRLAMIQAAASIRSARTWLLKAWQAQQAPHPAVPFVRGLMVQWAPRRCTSGGLQQTGA